MQSTLDSSDPRRLHVAIIMDGNGRWARERGRPRTAGHRAGARAVRRTVEAAIDLGVGTLTLYAFSSDNWKRPQGEVATLMRLFREYLGEQAARCVEHDVRLVVIGRRDRLPADVVEAIGAAERLTARCGGPLAAPRGRLLRARLDPGGGAALLRRPGSDGRARRVRQPSRSRPPRIGTRSRRGPSRSHGRRAPSLRLPALGVRLRRALLPSVMWPDFNRAHLQAALAEFATRERRFGALSTPRPANSGTATELRRLGSQGAVRYIVIR